MTLNVLLLARYGRTGASSRLRLLQYLPGLDDYDIDVYPSFFLDDYYLEEMYAGRRPSMSRTFGFYSDCLRQLIKAHEFDVIWVEKEALPWVPHLVELGALRSLPLVVDFDDAWHLRYRKSPNPLVRLVLGRKLERLARRAQFVVVANDYLRDWAEQAGARRIICVPTVVDLQRYAVAGIPASGPFTIGWIGTPETARYLSNIRGALEQVLQQDNTRLLLVGADPSFLSHPNVEVEPWSEASEARLLERIHVGIMPLSEGAWELGKSGYKLVQYMAANRPVIASPVGVNCELVQNGVNGFFATTEEEWVANFDRLRANPTLISAMGSAGRRIAESRFSLKTTVPQIANVLLTAGAARIHRNYYMPKLHHTVIDRIWQQFYLSLACGWIGLLWLWSCIPGFSSPADDWRPFWLRRRQPRQA